MYKDYKKEDYLFLIRDKDISPGIQQFRPLNENEVLPNIDYDHPISTMVLEGDKEPFILLFKKFMLLFQEKR